MANTYTQLYIQLVFAVQGRQSLISEKNRIPLEKYISGIVTNQNCKLLAIYCNPDHIHILIGLHPSIAISDITRDIKASSSKWINQNNWINGQFRWQHGFGAFSYAKTQVDTVVKYILNQHEHHKKTRFRDEYLDFLEKYDIQFDKKYLFEWYKKEK